MKEITYLESHCSRELEFMTIMTGAATTGRQEGMAVSMYLRAYIPCTSKRQEKVGSTRMEQAPETSRVTLKGTPPLRQNLPYFLIQFHQLGT